MSFLNPNPPVETDPFVVGLAALNVAGLPYGGNTIQPVFPPTFTFAQVGAIYNATVRSNLNAVTQIHRAASQSVNGAAGVCGWFGAGLSAANENGPAALFPGEAGDSGFKAVIVGGLDSNIGAAATTDFLMGVSFTNSNQMPTLLRPLTQATDSWFGLYQTGGVMNVGFKNVGGAITSLASMANVLSWAPYQGWRLTIDTSPFDLSTTWLLEQLSAKGRFSIASVGVTGAWNPGRNPLQPEFMHAKAAAADNHIVWSSSYVVRSYIFGTASV